MLQRLLLIAVTAVGCGGEPQIIAGLPPQEAGEPLGVENVVQTDVIAQAQPPLIDVMWLIDNSCSMSCIVGCHGGSATGSVTDEIVANFPAFIQHFQNSGVDYHIGVVTTDLDNPAETGKLQKGLGNLWIDNTTTNPLLAFDAMAVKGTGTDGSGNEKGLGAAYTAVDIEGNQYNDGFFRDDSNLHTIVLSNESDHTPDSLISVNEFIDWYGNLRTPDKRSFHSIVCLDENSEACRLERGRKYIQVSHEIGGIVWDIEDTRWGRLLDDLGAQSAGLSREYYLTQLPVPGTLTVAVNDPDTGNYIEFDEVPFDSTKVGYFFNQTRNSVLFINYLPEPRATVELSYEKAAANYGGGSSE